MFYNETLAMASIVVADTVVFAPVRNQPKVAALPSKIDVSSSLTPPLTPSYQPYVPQPLPPSLPPEPLQIIVTPLYPSGLVADKSMMYYWNITKRSGSNMWKEQNLNLFFFDNDN